MTVVLRTGGFVVWLRTSVAEQLKRLRNDGSRPLLAVPDRDQRLAAMAELRDPLYREASDLVFESIYTMDRVAYDDRPQSLAHLPPTRRRAAVHEMIIEPWGPAPSAEGGEARDN